MIYAATSAERIAAEPFAVEWRGNRRDTCYAIGEKMLELNSAEAAKAWASLGRHLIRLGERDIPKFSDLLAGINAANMVGGISGLRGQSKR